jgi:hypothetical protein
MREDVNKNKNEGANKLYRNEEQFTDSQQSKQSISKSNKRKPT